MVASGKRLLRRAARYSRNVCARQATIRLDERVGGAVPGDAAPLRIVLRANMRDSERDCYVGDEADQPGPFWHPWARMVSLDP